MPELTLEDRTYYDTRWQCECGRFVPDSSIESVDGVDPSAYYGIATTTAYECGRCGRREGMPRCTAVRAIVLPQEFIGGFA